MIRNQYPAAIAAQMPLGLPHPLTYPEPTSTSESTLRLEFPFVWQISLLGVPVLGNNFGRGSVKHKTYCEYGDRGANKTRGRVLGNHQEEWSVGRAGEAGKRAWTLFQWLGRAGGQGVSGSWPTSAKRKPETVPRQPAAPVLTKSRCGQARWTDNLAGRTSKRVDCLPCNQSNKVLRIQ